MKLTVNQVMQKAINEQTEGNLEEAERLYQDILKAEPKNPDANHNLGALNVSLKKIDIGLSFLKTALDLDSNREQFWFSYIAILIDSGRFEEAQKNLKIAKEKGFKNEKFVTLEAYTYFHSGNSLKGMGRLEEAEASYRQAIFIKSDYIEAHNNLGNTLKKIGKTEEALASFRQAIAINPELSEAHNNLGTVLQEIGKTEEALASYRQAISLKNNYAEAHSNLGNALQELSRFEEAEASCRQAISLKNNYAEAHSNLGNALQELNRLEEAEASYKHALALKPDYAEAHNNLGNALQELNRLEEAEASYKHALALKPDYAEAHSNLGTILYASEGMDSALESLEKADNIDPTLNQNKLLLSILKSRRAREESEIRASNQNSRTYGLGLTANPFISKRVVESELITNLLERQSRDMDTAFNTPVFGNGRCSLNYNLFEDPNPIMKTLESDLISIIKHAVKSEIHVIDSFFNIYGAGAGISPHTHLTNIDKKKYINLADQKYSLVYYLSIGDQDCSEPGILKLYDPVEDILPYKGMIVIFPAGRRHSAVYGGKKDRIVVGVNFYSL
jgi:tetratricopeptide (TPR) repeat protein